MHFGLYLVEENAIEAEDFVMLLRTQLETRPLLGALAIELGLLTSRQVFEILNLQAENPQARFGDLACQLGYVTPEQLAALLEQQARREAPLEKLLVEGGILSQAQVARYLLQFRSKNTLEIPSRMAACS